MFNEFPNNISVSRELERQLLDSDSHLVETIKKMDDRSMETLSDEITSKCLKLFFYNNQYLNVDDTAKAKIKNTYSQFILSIKEILLKNQMTLDQIKQMVISHHLELKSILYYYNEKEMDCVSPQDRYLSPKVCSEYSAPFQLQLLGLEEDQLLEPILDIGCGSEANLVSYLREIGREAYGIERQLEIKNDYLEEANWLTYEFGQDKWSTVISNMAFSNHYFHQEITGSDQVKIYEHKYYEILKGLKKNGSFIYAPGLPSIEEKLDESYEVEKMPIKGANDSRLYVTKIKRV